MFIVASEQVTFLHEMFAYGVGVCRHRAPIYYEVFKRELCGMLFPETHNVVSLSAGTWALPVKSDFKKVSSKCIKACRGTSGTGSCLMLQSAVLTIPGIQGGVSAVGR